MQKIGNYIQWLPDRLRIYLTGNNSCFGIFTHLTKKERLLLYRLARSLPRNCCVLEVGSYLGASASFLASGVKGGGGRVFCVDTWTNEGMSEGLKDTYGEFLTNIEPYKDVIIPLRGRSENVAKEFDKKIDMLFIDGDHSYEAVKADAAAWLPKLNVNTIVVFHDYQWAEGVQKVVAELVRPISLDGGNSFDNMYWTRIGMS
jgi:predicted O-methyltransferase YrrM